MVELLSTGTDALGIALVISTNVLKLNYTVCNHVFNRLGAMLIFCMPANIKNSLQITTNTNTSPWFPKLHTNVRPCNNF